MKPAVWLLALLALSIVAGLVIQQAGSEYRSLEFQTFPGEIKNLEVALKLQGIDRENETISYDIYLKNAGKNAISFTEGANSFYTLAVGGWCEPEGYVGRDWAWPDIDGEIINPGNVFQSDIELDFYHIPSDGIAHLMLLNESRLSLMDHEKPRWFLLNIYDIPTGIVTGKSDEVTKELDIIATKAIENISKSLVDSSTQNARLITEEELKVLFNKAVEKSSK